MKRFIVSFAILFTLLISSSAHALITTTIVEYDNTKYEISYMSGPFFNIEDELTSTPWWGDRDKAAEFAILVDDQLGMPGGGNLGPWFAWQEFNVDQLSGVACNFFSKSCDLTDTDALFKASATTYYAKSSVVPIPAAAWLFGSALLGLVGYSRRKANL